MVKISLTLIPQSILSTRQDAVGILLKIVENWKGNQTYNAVTPFHPTRKEYYTQMAKMAGLSPPKFEETGTIRGIISSKKVLFELELSIHGEKLVNIKLKDKPDLALILFMFTKIRFCQDQRILFT